MWVLRDALFFFFKQKTAYDMRISDWSSDVCSSDLRPLGLRAQLTPVDIGGQIVLKIMVAGHFVLLAALFVQPHPETAVLHKNVLDTHGERRADPRERIDHQPDYPAHAHTRRHTHVHRNTPTPRPAGGPHPPLPPHPTPPQSATP